MRSSFLPRIRPRHPSNAGVRRLAALACATLLLASCGRKDPAAPQPHSITGRVELVGAVIDEQSHVYGNRTARDADGVVVELTDGASVIARTTTVDGIYRFDGVPQGGYRARTRLLGRTMDSTRVLTIASVDVTVADTLRLASFGDLVPAPNPVLTSTLIYFVVPDTVTARIEIRDLAGETFRLLHEMEYLPGFVNVAFWDGFDSRDRPASAAYYWATFVAGDDVRAQLLFRAPNTLDAR